jgi:hypothetical protein
LEATTEVAEIPTAVLESVDTLDELEDWMTANNPRVMRELRQARREDQAGKPGQAVKGIFFGLLQGNRPCGCTARAYRIENPLNASNTIRMKEPAEFVLPIVS